MGGSATGGTAAPKSAEEFGETLLTKLMEATTQEELTSIISAIGPMLMTELGLTAADME
jgi:hypothetical protein